MLGGWCSKKKLVAGNRLWLLDKSLEGNLVNGKTFSFNQMLSKMKISL